MRNPDGQFRRDWEYLRRSTIRFFQERPVVQSQAVVPVHMPVLSGQIDTSLARTKLRLELVPNFMNVIDECAHLLILRKVSIADRIILNEEFIEQEEIREWKENMHLAGQWVGVESDSDTEPEIVGLIEEDLSSFHEIWSRRRY